MPRTDVILYKENDGSIPLLDWLASIPNKAVAKCRLRIGQLAELGHELRRPHADYLRDGVYELRAGNQGVNYRVLYFFHGHQAVVISHGIIKERRVPPVEIDRAIRRKRRFESDAESHTYREV